MLKALQLGARNALVPLLYRYPPFVLQPERLAVYLGGLLERCGLEGDVAEVGCNLGGTAVIAATMLRRMGFKGRYICYDTFGGFVPEQFAADIDKGTDARRAGLFAVNSARLVRRILDYHGCADVALVEGDIVTVDEVRLSPAYAAVLLDIDLSEPTYAALARFWPRIVPGGVVYVDDCPENYGWKARLGYQQFCREQGLAEDYSNGLGVLHRPPR